MGKWPFDPFAYFGYISNGIISVLIIDMVYLQQLLTGPGTGDFTGGIILLGLAYIFGQIASGGASWVIENFILRTIIGVPTGYLLDLWPKDSPRRILRYLPWRYPNAWGRARIDGVLNYAKSNGFKTQSPIDLFGALYADYLHGAKDQSRLHTIRNQYHFARNISFTLMFWGLVLFASAFWFGLDELRFEHMRKLGRDVTSHTESVSLWWISGACIFVGLVMFPRYLKFVKLFHEEVLTWIATRSGVAKGPKPKS